MKGPLPLVAARYRRALEARGATKRGFTLLEVLVATVIMAVAVSWLLSKAAARPKTSAPIWDSLRGTPG